MSSAAATPTQPEQRHDWREAGAAWGRRADDWACLFEHYSIDVLVAFADRLALAEGVRLLDVACGAGLGARVAAGTGATVSGIDASDELVAIARARAPQADLRVGSMFALPWADATFDAVMSINGIWGGCGAALDEAWRVLRPGGTIGISFWGAGPPLDIRECFRVFAQHAPREHVGSMVRLNDISVLGVAEQMLQSAGFEVIERGQRISMTEWPDAEIAWRAVSSVGPAVPALRAGDVAVIKREVLRALEPCRDERGTYRSRGDHQFVIARKPS